MSLILAPTQDVLNALVNAAFGELVPMGILPALAVAAVGLSAAVLLATLIVALATRARPARRRTRDVPGTGVFPAVYGGAAPARKAL